MASVATVLTVALIAWLLYRDRALRGHCSNALWIPVLWLTIIGSRPISVWLGCQVGEADVNQVGSPVDRLFYLVLIVAAFVVVQRRQVHWKSLITQNKCLAAYFFWIGLSTLWADDPFISFKRWIKEFGNVCMVLVILTERDPVEALKSVLFRCGCFMIPVSVLYIKYYPYLGRYFDRWTWEYSYGGVTTNKNTLGMGLFVCGLGLFWSLLDIWRDRLKQKVDLLAYAVIMLMCLWLWHMANTATSLVTSFLCVMIIIGLRFTAIRNTVHRIGFFGIFIPLIAIALLNAVFNPLQMLTESLGRDMTFTGRTLIWQRVLQSDINPVIGAGYCSFWEGDRADRISADLGFYFRLREAHDGYLEVYLNTGLVGLGLIIMVLLSNFKKVISRAGSGSSFDHFRLAAIVGAMIYNITESEFAGLEMLWIFLLLALVDPPQAEVLDNNNPIEAAAARKEDAKVNATQLTHPHKFHGPAFKTISGTAT